MEKLFYVDFDCGFSIFFSLMKCFYIDIDIYRYSLHIAISLHMLKISITIYKQ